MFNTTPGVMQLSWSRWIAIGIPIAAAAYVGIAWLVVYLIDFKGVFSADSVLCNLQDCLAHPPILWIELFQERSPTELGQWALLLSAAVISVITALELTRRGGNPLSFWLLSIGLLIMYAEDGHNVRHLLSSFLADTLLQADSQSLEWRRSLARSFIEIGAYAVLGGLMSLTLWLKLRARVAPKSALLCFCAGFVAYFIAAAASATRNILDWYATYGAKIFNWLARDSDLPLDGHAIVHFQDPLGFWFMDYVFEESLELMGAALICSAVLGWWSYTSTTPVPKVA